jgi:hypothetical protein
MPLSVMEAMIHVFLISKLVRVRPWSSELHWAWRWTIVTTPTHVGGTYQNAISRICQLRI